MAKKQIGKPEKVVSETFYRTLQVKMTDEEIMVKGQALARSESQRYKLLGEIKVFSDARKPLIKDEEAKIAELTGQIESGKEPREVSCYWKYNYPKDGLKTLMTFEKNEEIEEYSMEDDEQSDLFINGVPEAVPAEPEEPAEDKPLFTLVEPSDEPEKEGYEEAGIDGCIGNCKDCDKDCNSRQKEAQEEVNEFPNSGKKWTREDEEKLEFLFKAGKTIEDLSEIFGRKIKGIKDRLVKLQLIEE